MTRKRPNKDQNGVVKLSEITVEDVPALTQEELVSALEQSGVVVKEGSDQPVEELQAELVKLIEAASGEVASGEAAFGESEADEQSSGSTDPEAEQESSSETPSEPTAQDDQAAAQSDEEAEGQEEEALADATARLKEALSEYDLRDCIAMVNPSRNGMDGAIRMRSSGMTVAIFDFGDEHNSFGNIVASLKSLGFTDTQIIRH